jgi:hypothetical protein
LRFTSSESDAVEVALQNARKMEVGDLIRQKSMRMAERKTMKSLHEKYGAKRLSALAGEEEQSSEREVGLDFESYE